MKRAVISWHHPGPHLQYERKGSPGWKAQKPSCKGTLTLKISSGKGELGSPQSIACYLRLRKEDTREIQETPGQIDVFLGLGIVFPTYPKHFRFILYCWSLFWHSCLWLPILYPFFSRTVAYLRKEDRPEPRRVKQGPQEPRSWPKLWLPTLVERQVSQGT